MKIFILLFTTTMLFAGCETDKKIVLHDQDHRVGAVQSAEEHVTTYNATQEGGDNLIDPQTAMETELDETAAREKVMAEIVALETEIAQLEAEEQAAQEAAEVEAILANEEKQLVSWGHIEAQRSLGNIDTVIIHSVYNPFDGDSHSLNDVLSLFKRYDVAPHYIIERDGTITMLVEEKNIAWHTGRSRVPDGRSNVNDFSIGIEMINSVSNIYTTAQYKSLRALLMDIKNRYAIRYVLGHDEIAVADPWHFDWEKINDLRHKARTNESL